jgi:hypothetical protein
MELLLIILVIALILCLPIWGYNNHWGYRPSGILGIVLLILLIWFFVAFREVEIKNTNGKLKIEMEKRDRNW